MVVWESAIRYSVARLEDRERYSVDMYISGITCLVTYQFHESEPLFASYITMKLADLGYPFTECTDSPMYKMFLR